MKSNFLNELRTKLNECRASQKDIDEILSDYEQLYDDALNSGKTDEDIFRVLGNPDIIVQDLKNTLQTKKERNIKNKIIAIMPFISLITFFLLGFYKDLWHPGWLVFLAIPISAIMLQARLKSGMIALMPFLSIIIFLIMGWGYGLWHVAWLVFLLIPVVAILFNTPLKKIPIAISPFITTIIFFILGFFYSLWDPAWLVFFIIPMIGILYSKSLLKIILLELAFIVAIGFYFYGLYFNESWSHLRWIGFLIPLAISMIYGDITFTFGHIDDKNRKQVMMMSFISLTAIIIFIVLGLLLDAWIWAWQVFLLVPMAAIILFGKFKLTTLMPFIAVILFFSIGYFFNQFQISWLAFLLIPIVAIIENA